MYDDDEKLSKSALKSFKDNVLTKQENVWLKNMVILMMKLPISKGEIFNGEDFTKSVDEAKKQLLLNSALYFKSTLIL